ncbi:hypothetical protein UFOVP28_14 [uncultured Caudovirales phage]|uniref:Uncharacterized protein n=1 Tax=uncultured Caudovirales phage TaxID=2100421 RepID=A0A6J5KR74_9CAUD|nr:hypothetical protein UFOVP28_14 [uncultured Caudovirales phage]
MPQINKIRFALLMLALMFWVWVCLSIYVQVNQ